MIRDCSKACLKIATIMEEIGCSVHARIVPFFVAADLTDGMAPIASQNFRPFAELERMRAGTQQVGSGSNWLVEQLGHHAVTERNLQVGAQTVYRDWQP
ncbi:MAG TPA: hypothetical protein VKH14_01100 [Candidatus Udaeobacter sp.]|nr:MAG: hypothetical protein DME78_10740 [Verrucomicrobiota bacterium]PYL34347.1 MAG: hypothetical protein DMF38_08620 [Verrucomicrobiota bacterium]HMC24049.1 hypothetical protein [Candidatus Udaeobacter sp.]